jgi:hypothetical protein
VIRVVLAVSAGIIAVGCGDGGGDEVDQPNWTGYYSGTRTLTSSTPCPRFTFAEGVWWTSLPREWADATGEHDLAFDVLETWSSPDGTASPTIHYALDAYAGTLEGEASTSFPFDTETASTTCSYTWDVHAVDGVDD